MAYCLHWTKSLSKVSYSIFTKKQTLHSMFSAFRFWLKQMLSRMLSAKYSLSWSLLVRVVSCLQLLQVKTLNEIQNYLKLVFDCGKYHGAKFPNFLFKKPSWMSYGVSILRILGKNGHVVRKLIKNAFLYNFLFDFITLTNHNIQLLLRFLPMLANTFHCGVPLQPCAWCYKCIMLNPTTMPLFVEQIYVVYWANTFQNCIASMTDINRFDFISKYATEAMAFSIFMISIHCYWNMILLIINMLQSLDA